MNYLKLIGGVVLGASAITAAALATKYAVDELEAQRAATRAARQKAEQDIQAAKQRTEEMRRQTEASLAETARKQKEDNKAHKAAMDKLKADARKQKEIAAIRDKALTDFENKTITVEQLSEILKSTAPKKKEASK